MKYTMKEWDQQKKQRGERCYCFRRRSRPSFAFFSVEI